MAIQGLRDTSNFVVDARPLHWRAAQLLLFPNGIAPLYALTSAMRTETVDDPEFNWWEKPMQTRRYELTANLDATGPTDTINVVADGITLKIGDLLLVEESGEILKVSTLSSVDTDILVDRGFASVPATAVLFAAAGVNPNLQLIGSVFEEGSNAPVGINFDPVKKFNFTQIFRDTLELTRTAIRTRLRTGDQVKEAKREALQEHSRAIEWALWLGERTENSFNGKPIRSTGGLKSFIPSENKVVVPAAALDMATFEGYMERAFKFGSSEKMGFCGNRALTALNQMARKNSAYQIVTGLKEFGMNVTRFITPHGELVVKTHPLFNQIEGGTTSGTDFFGLNSSLFIVDMGNLIWRPMKGDDTRFQQKLQDNDLDGEKSGFITEAGLEVQHGETHFLIENLNAGVVDP